MLLLLDTHTFLWFVTNPAALSRRVLALIQDADNIIYLSMASVWEMSIKSNAGKLQLTLPIQLFVERQTTQNDFLILPIELPHLAVVETLALHHRDPFDRLLIAQSLAENLPILSVDALFDKYSVIRFW